jgi:hypothetical protein
VTFSWKKLKTELSNSDYLLPADDLSSQRGIIAAAEAILDRMANGERLREVSWDGLASKRRKAVATASNGKGGNGKDGSGGAKPSGNSLVLNPAPKPVLPGPTGNAVKIPVYNDATITF